MSLDYFYRPHPKDGEGNVFSLSTPGGVPISHNALQHYPECHGADTWGVPISHNALQHYPEFHGADTWGGTRPGLARGGTLPGVPCQGVPCWGYPARGVPCWGVPCWGYPAWGDTLPGGTQLGQQKKYSLHGGQYASCVHAGGLSCYLVC